MNFNVEIWLKFSFWNFIFWVWRIIINKNRRLFCVLLRNRLNFMLIMALVGLLIKVKFRDILDFRQNLLLFGRISIFPHRPIPTHFGSRRRVEIFFGLVWYLLILLSVVIWPICVKIRVSGWVQGFLKFVLYNILRGNRLSLGLRVVLIVYNLLVSMDYLHIVWSSGENTHRGSLWDLGFEVFQRDISLWSS